MSERDTDCDVAIAGGGMIGTSLALALAPLGLRITVVEPIKRAAAEQPSFDDRTTALSRSTQRMFEAMQLWPDIVAAATPIRRIHVSDKGRFGFSHIDAEEQRVEALGYVVINRVLGEVLQAAIDVTSNIELICPGRIVDVKAADDAVAVAIDAEGSTQRLTARLLVAADGADSKVRELLGIGVTRERYDQRAIIGNLRPEFDLENVAYERFTGGGPLALLPMANQRAAFIWTVDEADAEHRLALDDRAFLAALQREFGLRLGRFSAVGQRASYPLTLSKALRLVATRAVLVGNAAHGLHPVAAQGFNLGMRDVAALCDCILESLEADGDIGAADVLERYARWRRADQKKLVGLTDGLVRVFGSPRPPVRLLRNLGMLGFDLIPGVRNAFARHAMGLAGRLPRLSRGVPLK